MKKNLLNKKKNLWKKISILSVSALLGISLMACGGKGAASKGSSVKSAEGKENAKSEEAKQGETKEGEELKGKISDIKDFMFVVTTDDGKIYALNFDKKPEGLEELKDGDEVIVHYTGELSEVDPFEGEILSVEKV